MTIPQWVFLSKETMNHVDQHDDGIVVVVVVVDDDYVVAMGDANDDNKYFDLVESVKVCVF